MIGNPGLKADSVSAAELKKVFLEESSAFSDGSHVEPVLAKGGAAHEAFVKEVRLVMSAPTRRPKASRR